ncbi:MAG: ATP-binding protein [Chloroflexi bacterium]|nr:ATP-binding protein [Chloroflexota bacterium]
MADKKNTLHLPDLTIDGFRGIESLAIPRLGRVTLIAGRNSVGKTTILEAVRIYAGQGSTSPLFDLLRKREEFSLAIDEDGDNATNLDWPTLFYGRNISQESHSSIGPANPADRVLIESTVLREDEIDELPNDFSAEAPFQVIRLKFRRNERIAPWIISLSGSRSSNSYYIPRAIRRLSQSTEAVPEIKCVSLGPDIITNRMIAELWDDAADLKEEGLAVESLKIIFGRDIEDVVMIGEDRSNRPSPWRVGGAIGGRRAKASLQYFNHRVPLKSLGDGAIRLYGIALGLINSRGGFLLIDEAENGLHYSVQHDFWSMVLQEAEANNVQVLATTHSADCIDGFALAASEHPDISSVYLRLDKDASGHFIVDYPKEDLVVASEHGTEMR